MRPDSQQWQASLEAPTTTEAVQPLEASWPGDRGLVSAVPQGQVPARPRPNLSDLTPGQEGQEVALDTATHAHILNTSDLGRVIRGLGALECDGFRGIYQRRPRGRGGVR
ncbi:MAG: hypothetical protein IRY99_27850 [Isosphaeraceae bacterium]|nr:hypothetical protein [Isosphaeraceae bacterium]